MNEVNARYRDFDWQTSDETDRQFLSRELIRCNVSVTNKYRIMLSINPVILSELTMNRCMTETGTLSKCFFENNKISLRSK
jgi:hypothetical protein